MAERGARSVGAVVAVAAMALGGVCAPGAMAADNDLEWYIDDTGVRDAWSQGFDGSGVKVAVIDSAPVADHPSLKGADITYDIAFRDDLEYSFDSCTATTVKGTKIKLDAQHAYLSSGQADGMLSSHGTDMAMMIVGNGQGYDGAQGVQGVAPKASVQFLSDAVDDTGMVAQTVGCHTDRGNAALTYLRALDKAVESCARIVNMSFVSGLDADTDVYVKALRRGVVVVNGRDNTTDPGANDFVGEPTKQTYFPGTVTVNAVDRDGNLQSVSDVKDGNVAIVAPGVDVAGYQNNRRQVTGTDGTSNATALVSGYLALVMQKWPKATGNQVLQSLVRNTKDNTSGEAQLDPEHKTGFGQIDLAKLLKTDPSQYPDINPLLAEAVERSDQHEETKGLYTDDRSSWGDDTYGETDPFPYTIKADLDDTKINDEYQRQKTAWTQVEQCQKDGGSDCMRYSATANADRDEPLTYKSSSNAALWVGVVVAVVVAAGAAVVFVAWSRKRKTGKA